MKTITAIFFDVGGVCLTNGWDHIARQRAAKQFDYDYEEADARHRGVVDAFERGELDLEEYIDRVIFFRDRSFSREEYAAFMKAQSQPNEGTLAVLADLAKQHGLLVATINNESFDLNLYRIKQFQLHRYFNAFFSSCFLRMRKPSSRIYESALKITQREPSECIFVDDRDDNIVTAGALGIQTLKFTGADALRTELEHRKVLPQTANTP